VSEEGLYADKYSQCPLCGSKEDEGSEHCFHCMNCCYLQCCDANGFYAQARKDAARKEGE